MVAALEEELEELLSAEGDAVLAEVAVAEEAAARRIRGDGFARGPAPAAGAPALAVALAFMVGFETCRVVDELNKGVESAKRERRARGK